jgi:hypothetical protein
MWLSLSIYNFSKNKYFTTQLIFEYQPMQNAFEKCDVEEFSQWGDVVIDIDLFCHRFV